MRDASDTLDTITGKDFPYFRGVWNRVIVALLAASFLPLLVIGGGMYFYSISALKEKTLEGLGTEVIQHKEAIDHFLAERMKDIRLLSANLNLQILTTPKTLESVFHSLQGELPCFTDLGIIDGNGNHLAYVGPYDLMSRNYREAAWFRSVMERGEYVSDVFLGFRKVPHFIIAVKRKGKTGTWIMRATVDATYFRKIVSSTHISTSKDAFLINRKGVFQSNPRTGNQLMTQSEFRDIEPFEGVKIEEYRGEFCAMVWLQRVPWLCVVKIDRGSVFTALHRVRNIGIVVFVLGSILIVMTVLLTTNYLVTLLEIKRRSIQVLGQKFQRISHLVSSVELSPGFLREIGDTMANIDVAAAWTVEAIRQGDLHEIDRTMYEIRAEISRGKKIIERFTGFFRPHDRIAGELDVNALLKEVLGVLDNELRFRNIAVHSAYQEGLPVVSSDRSKLNQVFLNIVLNAVYSIDKNGEIRIATGAEQGGVTVTVADNGPGIPEEAIDKIFDPFFTTRTGRIGLGLSICAEIMDTLGGSISVRSSPGRGASFTILIPFKVRPSRIDEATRAATAAPS